MTCPESLSAVRGPFQPCRVFDLHCDTIDMLAMRDHEPFSNAGRTSNDEGFTDLEHNECALDLARMEDYGWCQCFAIWVPDSYRHHDAAVFYQQARDWFFQQLQLHADRVQLVRDARTIDSIVQSGKVAALLTLENSTPINHSVRAITELAHDGVKMVTLTWNGRNSIGSGNDTQEGLTTFGREAIRAFECNRIVMDVSHLNGAGFNDFLDVFRRPFVASHSNSRAICDVPRNLTDDQFRAIRDAGGLVGLNFYERFITTRDTRTTGTATFEELCAHVEHFIDLGGEDTISLGSDWDGSTVPAWLASCDTIGELHQRFCGVLGPRLTDKLFYENARDFFVRNETL